MSETKSDDASKTLKVVDEEVWNIIKAEEARQREGLELIASENFTSQAVMEAVGSCLTNKYSEGLPGRRYYGGNEQIDKLEELCQKRALKAFNLNEWSTNSDDEEKPAIEWGVNVQPYSGSVANFAAFTALLEPGDKVMGLSLQCGGHLSHGYFRKGRNVNVSSKYFSSLPYETISDPENPKYGWIDYDKLEQNAKLFYPKLIVAGGSAYPQDWDYARVKKIADSVGAYLMCDIAHYSGLVATGILVSPFEYADVVTMTTHKSLRGPRAALVFYRKELAQRVNMAVFPACQGGPHNHAIAGVAVQLKEVASPEFKEYSKQVVSNAKTLAKHLMDKGYKMVTDGTETHLILWDLRPQGMSGGKLEYLCDQVNITINKNTVPGNGNAISPKGVRIGTPALTSRGFLEEDFKIVGDILHECVELALEVQSSIQGEKAVTLKAFKSALEGNSKLGEIKAKVTKLAAAKPMPGKKL